MTRSIEQITIDCPKVSDLRKEVARLNKELKNFGVKEPLIRKGLEIKISETKREHNLPEHISKLEVLLEKHTNQTVETTEETTTSQTIETTEETTSQTTDDTENDYTDSEQEKRFIAQTLYKSTEKNDDDLVGFREYRLRLEKSGKYYLPEFSILVARTRVMIEAYADSKSKSNNGKASPGGLQATRVEILKYFRELCESEKDKFGVVNETTLMDTYEEFEDAVRGAFKDISKIKYELYKEKRDSGERDVRKVEVRNFVNWAIELISNLPDNSARWKDIAIAVMLLTGRRQSEVMSSGVFEYVDDSHLMFEGQLKRHTKDAVPSVKIPVIGGIAQQVIDAIEWLEKHGKRTLPTERTYEGLQKAAKKSHNRCSRYISETMSKLENLVEITNDKTWNDNKGQNVFKGHLTRQIYAQVCAKLYKSDDQKKHSYIADILLESRDAAPSYDRDIKIVDADKIN